MQQHVHRFQYKQSFMASKRYRVGEQGMRVHLDPSRFGQDRMVHINNRSAPDMSHRRDFVHPAPVVAIVIGAMAHALPARDHQPGLDFIQTLTGHQYVHIRKGSAMGGWQACHEIGSPFQQNDRHACFQQSLPNAFDLPSHGGVLSLDHAHS